MHRIEKNQQEILFYKQKTPPDSLQISPDEAARLTKTQNKRRWILTYRHNLITEELNARQIPFYIEEVDIDQAWFNRCRPRR